MPSQSSKTNKTPAARSAKGAAVLKARQEAGKTQRIETSPEIARKRPVVSSSAARMHRKQPARRTRRLGAGENHWPRNPSFASSDGHISGCSRREENEPLSHSLKHVDRE